MQLVEITKTKSHIVWGWIKKSQPHLWDRVKKTESSLPIFTVIDWLANRQTTLDWFLGTWHDC